MANLVLTDCKVLWAGFDLTADTNYVTAGVSVEAKDNTVFGQTAHSRLAGLKMVQIEHRGFNNNANTQPGDTELFNAVGSTDRVFSLAVTSADASAGYFATGAFETDYTNLGAVGDVFGYDVKIAGDGDLYKGTVVLPLSPARVASGTGSIQQLGAVSATQSVRAASHVTAVSGTGNPSFQATIQSAAAVGFASPTNRVTLATQTAAGAVTGTTAGAITDQFWRVNYTITGTTPSFNAFVIVSIQ